ncbi:hypothetical protein BYT27DRAFT_7187599 [Phlegmacium glaucopus]|nr:hypothetical protein BYT27DRAFT_7187599 [Phlegmacium glaucopus]
MLGLDDIPLLVTVNCPFRHLTLLQSTSLCHRVTTFCHGWISSLRLFTCFVFIWVAASVCLSGGPTVLWSVPVLGHPRNGSIKTDYLFFSVVSSSAIPLH